MCIQSQQFEILKSGYPPGLKSFAVTGKGKTVPATKGKSASKAEASPKQKAWTKEDDAARKIQTKIRQYLARKSLQKKKKEKQDYEDLMDRLEREVCKKKLFSVLCSCKGYVGISPTGTYFLCCRKKFVAFL